jgi:hypothetical protein
MSLVVCTFSFLDHFKNWSAVESPLFVNRDEAWRPGVYLDNDFVFSDVVAATVPKDKIIEAAFKTEQYARLITQSGIVALALSETTYDASQYEKAARRLAAFLGGKFLPPDSLVRPSDLYLHNSHGERFGLI